MGQPDLAKQAIDRTSDNVSSEDVPGEMPPQETRHDAMPKTQLTLLITSAFVAMFLVALDRTIIATAIPYITDEFHSLPDMGWYGSAYLLTSCASQLLFGKLYTFFDLRATLLSSILLFEVGSTVCGAAPSSDAFIVGRAICGIGAAGIFSGVIVVITRAVPLEKRPKLQGMMGAIFGISSILGPLVGGAFTSNVTWRWCFYINLPIGGVASVVIWFCLPPPEKDGKNGGLSLKEKMLQLDFPGTTALVPGLVSLLLALQWGGQMYKWNNWRIILLLTLAGVLLTTFVAIQIYLPKTATVPPRIFKRRSIPAGLVLTTGIIASMYITVYFLPLWFQTIIRVSPVQSGIRFLPTVLAQVLAVIASGFATQKVGYYTPFAIVGCAIMIVGAGLLTTLQIDTREGLWIGYQIIYGFGLGLSMQASNLAAQTVLPKEDVPVGITLMVFTMGLSPAIFTSVGQNVLDNQLIKRLVGFPGFNPALVTAGGATSLINSLPANLRLQGLQDYNESLRKVFQISLIMVCVGFLGAVSLEWVSLLEKGKGNAAKAADQHVAFSEPKAEV